MSSKPGPKMQSPTHEQVLHFVKQNSCPFVTTADVAEEFSSVSRRTVNSRLNDLHSQDKLSKRRIGAKSVVWWTSSQSD